MLHVCRSNFELATESESEEGESQGGVTPIGAVSRAATGVKMRSNGQGTFWGSVKRSSSVLGTI